MMTSSIAIALSILTNNRMILNIMTSSIIAHGMPRLRVTTPDTITIITMTHDILTLSILKHWNMLNLLYDDEQENNPQNNDT
jgi:hypothetical protein